MKRNKINITDDLVKELKKYGSSYASGMAAKTRDILTETTVYAIEEFYNDYSPIYYHRHYYNFLKKSYVKYYNNPHNSIVRGGVLLSPSGMDDIYQDSTDEVFDMVYHGYHGIASAFYSPKTFETIPKVMSPSPLEIIENIRDEIVDNIGDYKEYGVKKANNNSYTTFHTV